MPVNSIKKTRLEEKYLNEVMPALLSQLGCKNRLALPRVEKVVINQGIGDIVNDRGAIDKTKAVMASLTGQQPAPRRAKKSIAEFKIREGNIIGLMVVLRGKRMYQFLDKLYSIVLPRVRDFQGVSRKAFDGHGNYTLGLHEQIVFPEVDYDKIDKLRGLEITITTSTNKDDEALKLLELLGMPFEKRRGKVGQKK